MGTYSKPTLVLDTSLGAFSTALQSGTDKAIAAVAAKKKQEQIQLQKQLKKDQKAEQDKIDWQLKQTTAYNKDAQKINMVDFGEQINPSGIGVDGKLIHTAETAKVYSDFAATLPSDITDAELEIALNNKYGNEAPDVNTFYGALNERGVPLETQLQDFAKVNYLSIPYKPQTSEEIDAYSKSQEKIGITMTDGVKMIGYIKGVSKTLNINGSIGTYQDDGTPFPPKAGRENTILQFPKDDSYSLLQNTGRDFALNINMGKYKYDVIDNEAVVIVTQRDGTKSVITKSALENQIAKTGSGFIGVTDGKKFNSWLKVLKTNMPSNLSWKGDVTTNTFDTLSDDDPDKKKRITQKITNIYDSQIKLQSAVNKIIDEGNLGFKGSKNQNETNLGVQNNWQMMGGPIEANEGDPKLDASGQPYEVNGIQAVWTQEEIDESVQYTGTPIQRERAKMLLFNVLNAKYMQDANTLTTSKKMINGARGQVLTNRAQDLLDSGIQFPESSRLIVNTYFRTPNSISPAGDTDIGLSQVLDPTNYANLQKDNFKGKVEVLNAVSGGAQYMTGKMLKDLMSSSGAEIVDENGNKIADQVPSKSIYLNSGGKWLRKQNLEGKDAFVRTLISKGGFGTNTTTNKALSMYESSNATTTTTTTTTTTGTGATGGTGAGVTLPPSDRRLKKNIVKINESESGLNIYEFEYINKEGVYQGVMSDEIPKEAVLVDNNGYDTVDYSKLDVDFKRIK